MFVFFIVCYIGCLNHSNMSYNMSYNMLYDMFERFAPGFTEKKTAAAKRTFFPYTVGSIINRWQYQFFIKILNVRP